MGRPKYKARPRTRASMSFSHRELELIDKALQGAIHRVIKMTVDDLTDEMLGKLVQKIFRAKAKLEGKDFNDQ